MNIEEKIELYKTVKEAADKYKQHENELRLEILDELFPTAGEGTHKVDIGNIRIKGVFGTNYTIDSKMLEDIEFSLSDDELACINYKPNLSLTAYKKLDASERANLDQCITAKPAMPFIKIEDL